MRERALIFADRADAGRQLADVLKPKYEGQPVLVLGLPRGGVPVAAEIARALHAPLDLLLVRKLGAPIQPELALGAVVDGHKPIVIRNEDVIAITGTSEAQLQAITRRELAEIERRRAVYRPYLGSWDPKGKVTIVVDDGIATGATIHAGIKAVRLQGPKAIVVAVPVASREAIDTLLPEVDDLIVLETLGEFGAVGYFYRDFRQLDDADVIAILKTAQSS